MISSIFAVSAILSGSVATLDSSDSVKNLAPILALVVAGKDTLETIETIHVAEIIQKSAIFPDID